MQHCEIFRISGELLKMFWLLFTLKVFTLREATPMTLILTYIIKIVFVSELQEVSALAYYSSNCYNHIDCKNFMRKCGVKWDTFLFFCKKIKKTYNFLKLRCPFDREFY